MSENERRDAQADLAICEAASPGPWTHGGLDLASYIETPLGAERILYLVSAAREKIAELEEESEDARSYAHDMERHAKELEAQIAELRGLLTVAREDMKPTYYAFNGGYLACLYCGTSSKTVEGFVHRSDCLTTIIDAALKPEETDA